MLIDYMLIGIIAILIIIHTLERRDLYNRIMSHDITDYRRKPPDNTHKAVSKRKRLLDEWRKGNDTI